MITTKEVRKTPKKSFSIHQTNFFQEIKYFKLLAQGSGQSVISNIVAKLIYTTTEIKQVDAPH